MEDPHVVIAHVLCRINDRWHLLATRPATDDRPSLVTAPVPADTTPAEAMLQGLKRCVGIERVDRVRALISDRDTSGPMPTLRHFMAVTLHEPKSTRWQHVCADDSPWSGKVIECYWLALHDRETDSAVGGLGADVTARLRALARELDPT